MVLLLLKPNQCPLHHSRCPPVGSHSLSPPSARLRLLPVPPHRSQLSRDLETPKLHKPLLELLIILSSSACSATPDIASPAAVLQAAQLPGYGQAELCGQHWESKGKETWRLPFPHPPLPVCFLAFHCWEVVLILKTLRCSLKWLDAVCVGRAEVCHCLVS